MTGVGYEFWLRGQQRAKPTTSVYRQLFNGIKYSKRECSRAMSHLQRETISGREAVGMRKRLSLSVYNATNKPKTSKNVGNI